MGLADVLQWADATAKCGVLTLQRSGTPVWIAFRDRSIVAASEPPLAAMPIEVLDQGAPPPEGEGFVVKPEVAVVEYLYDQFLDADDRFSFREGEPPSEGALELKLSIQLMVMEGLRHVDEWPEIRSLYGNSSATVQSLPEFGGGRLPPVQKALLSLAQRGVSLTDARLSLGLSQPALLRNVEALRRLGAVTVAGCPEGGDLITRMVNQAGLLLELEQFDEAAHVFGALLSADPGARRIKGLLLEAERRQTVMLYGKLPESASVGVSGRPTLPGRRLMRSDRVVLELVNGRWDVATLVLASPLREVETLKALLRLKQSGFVRLKLEEPGEGEDGD